jgi:fructosamine-3-kinase
VNAATRAALARELGSEIAQLRPLAGGDINQAFELRLADGRRVFAKTNAAVPPDFFDAEAHGLRWLAQAQALRVPEVLAVATGQSGAHGERELPFLALELLESSAPAPGFDERLGQGLARLHGHAAPSFGLERDNFVGSLPQANHSRPSWAEFYRERRLLPSLERARRRNLLDAEFERAAEHVLSRLEQLVGPSEPPARLHGDLWAGNLHVARGGEPALIDPAVYGGHREVDLAMMRLFGGFGARVFAAYAESAPLAPGHDGRVALYQLYPLLVHVVLFGAGYVPRARSCLQPYL